MVISGAQSVGLYWRVLAANLGIQRLHQVFIVNLYFYPNAAFVTISKPSIASNFTVVSSNK
ncbi:hypothetical protein B9Q13_00715 [Candidatus Marsarchaeota G2 archaeon ECH_B_SAG-G16]|uniref:Uncharacterized protein n=1 Tax=Candidatus Marsarchaeota G2 archaeon ECH_B_SAG-G16 TaxID=1978167 RepID=A0A2R6C4G7_9ARCH|nr:MAG: hypothetical protein B9Q13_00715 [Candidatus Marsarchaeota G2 archaeon ECH_B_SAG-G16]